jgi:hypothetical protein
MGNNPNEKRRESIDVCDIVYITSAAKWKEVDCKVSEFENEYASAERMQRKFAEGRQ